MGRAKAVLLVGCAVVAYLTVAGVGGLVTLAAVWMIIRPAAIPSPVVPSIAPLPSPTQTPLPMAGEDSLQALAMIPSARSDLEGLGPLTRYTISATLDLTHALVTATEFIDYVNTTATPLEEIWFGLYVNAPDYGGRIAVSQVSVAGQGVIPPLPTDTAYRVPLPTPLGPGQRVTISMDFVTQAPRDWSIGYAIITYSRGVLALASWYPIARVYDREGWHTETGPVWGDPTYSASALYTVFVTSPQATIVVASGSRQQWWETREGRKVEVYRTGPMRDFYIIASDAYRSSSTQVGETVVTSYYLPEDEDSGRLVLSIAARALDIFGSRFGPYPFSEFDIAEAPTAAGGIEYPGIVIISDRLYRGERRGRSLDFVVAHEVAHQWWYSLVGNDQIREPWLDEALANYSAIIYFEQALGPAEAEALRRTALVAPYERAIQRGRDAPVNQPVARFTPEDYDAIVYAKGALFFDTLRRQMGDDRFFRFLRTYAHDYAYGIAHTEDVARLLQGMGGPEAMAIFRQWILGVLEEQEASRIFPQVSGD